ncbi:hypothetical protein BH20ACI4_BH20ACI4_12970 [soil metagenome]
MKRLAVFIKHKLYPFFVLTFLIAAFFIWKSAPNVESAKQTSEDNQIENYDIRTDKSEAAQTAVEKFVRESGRDASLISSEKRNVRKTVEELKTDKRRTIEYNEDLRTPEVISAEIGTDTKLLTAPSGEKRADILRRFLMENSALFGLDETQISELETTADYTNPNGVLSFVHLEQKIGDVPVFRGEVKAGFTKRGEMFRVVNNLAPALDYQNLNADFGNAETAVINAVKNIGLITTENDLKKIETASDDLKIIFERGQFAERTTAEKVYFPIDFGAARTAWRVFLWTKTDTFYIIIDADTGTLLWRKNLTEHQTQTATFNIYGNATSMLKTADSPSPFTPGCPDPNNCPQPPITSRTDFTLIGNEPPYDFNNLGWISDGENRTIGNNVEAGIDRDPTPGIDPNGWAFGNPNRVFSYAYNPAPGNPPPGEEPLPTTQTYPPSPFQQGSVTHAFYTVNRWHDELYLLGFTEAARNYQTDNFGRGGLGNDRISVRVHTFSANFSAVPDGMPGQLVLNVWTNPNPDRDSALDSHIIVHEATHGLSHRLHGNSTGLTSNMARGMGEGWSDFYALAMLSEPADDLCGIHAVGGYALYQVASGFEANYYYGLRRFPTARINCLGANSRPHSPLTFRHANSNCNTDINTIGAFPRGPGGTTTCDQAHNLGEIWNATLWEIRGVLIDQYGAAEGNRRTLQYVTDGMKLAPLNPTFLQERDAIIAAAFVSDPNDVKWVREGFRRRGMGFSASLQNAGTGANNTIVTEAFDFPNIQIVNPFSVSDAPGNNNGYPEAGEKVILNVTVTNQTGDAITNAYVNANGGSNVILGTIANGQTVQAQIPFKIPRNAVCISHYSVTINAGSDVGVQSPVIKQFQIGVPVGGPPAEFTNATPIDMPNGQPTTTSGPFAPYPSNISVSGLIGNKTIKVKLNGFHHEFEDDVDLLLVGPGGQKFILMSDVGGSTEQLTPITFSVGDSGDTLLPDSAAIVDGTTYRPSNVGANDPFDAPAPAAPYENAAPGGSATFASVFGTDGAALNGTWSLYGDDDAGGDPGRIDGGWTLIFESSGFICTTLLDSPRADFDGDGKTDMSVFRPTEGNWYLNRSTSGFTAINWGLNGDVLVPGDYDGDNMTDTAIKRGGDWYILRSCDNTTAIVNWGLASDIPVAGDYDGDFKTDYAVFRPSEGNWYILRSADGGNVIFNWGLSGDKPIVGDFDGDGKTDFTVYRDGVWYIYGSASGVKIVTFGLASDLPVPADYDGDHIGDIAVFRPSDGYWYILRSSNNAVDYIPFGLNGDIPVPGDYDGDGRYDQAVYRNGIWYLNQSTSGFTAAQFGLASDLPIPKSYIP